MGKIRSYRQRSATYWAVIKNNPTISSAELGRRYKGTNNAMRKQDRDSLVKELKSAVKLNRIMKDSNAGEKAKERVQKNTYNWAVKSSRKGRVLYPMKKGEDRRTVMQTFSDTTKNMVDGNFERYLKEERK